MIVLNEPEVMKRVQQWADSSASVRAAILTSSRVNPEPCIDQYSDYDIEVYVDDLKPYWDSDGWMEEHFGEILVRFPWKPRSFKDGWLTRLAVFKDGFRIDFQMTDLEVDKSHYVDGYRVLIDKDDITTDLPPPTYDGYSVKKPSMAEWETFTHEFWWEIVYVAKALARNELFYAKFVLDAQIRFTYFRKLIEWAICVEHGWETQPNKLGRFFRRFIDPKRWDDIESTFAGAGIEDNWSALENSMQLFRELSRQVGELMEYPYPDSLDGEVSEYIRTIHASVKGH